MELLNVDRSVVLIIDLQGKLMEQVHRPSLVIEGTRRLMTLAALFGVPVMLTEQYPRGLGETHAEILEAFGRLSVPKRRLQKTSFGCCGDPEFGTALDALRRGSEAGLRQVVVAGIEAHVCVMQTVIELLRAGDQVHLCWECISGRGAEYREWALARMQKAGAVVTNHESVGFEWARDKGHPAFREMSALFKEGQPG